MSGFRETGPAGKRSDERVRTAEPAVPVTKINVSDMKDREVEIPAANSDWHPVALQWYESLTESATWVYYEPTDWALAYVLATNLDRQLKPQVVGYNDEDHKVVRAVKPLSGADMSAFLKGCTTLLASEVDRRRAGIEIERAIQNTDTSDGADVPDNVVSFAEARKNSVKSG